MAKPFSVEKFDRSFFATPDHEAELLERVLLAFTYGTGASSSKAIFDFCFENVFDLLKPVSGAMWKYEPDQEWALWVSRGQEMTLPDGYSNWGEVNRASVLNRRTTALHLSGVNGSTISHLISPVILRGESCYVLHLAADGHVDENKSINSFIQTLAYLIVNFKFMDSHPHSGINGNSRSGDHDGDFSQRQREIIELISRNMTYQQIANRVGYSESTVKQEAMKIFRKLGVHNRNEAVRTLGQ